MFKYTIYIFGILVFVFTACTKETDDSISTPVHIDAAIANQGIIDGESRTSMVGSKASFIAGDKIGLFETSTKQSNIAYASAGVTWVPVSSPAYWYSSTATYTFYAYYPYQSAYSGTKVSMPVLANQTGGSSPNPTADMLVAGPLSQTSPSSIGLTFTHAFSLLQFNVKMGILGLLSAYSLNSFTVQGGNTTGSASPYGFFNKVGGGSDVGYNLTTKTVQADANTSTRFAQSLTIPLTGITILYTAATLYIIVLPGTYSNPAPGVSFNLSLLGILSPTNTSFANFSNTTFQPGMKYVYDVSVVRLGRSVAPSVTLTPQEVVPID